MTVYTLLEGSSKDGDADSSNGKGNPDGINTNGMTRDIHIDTKNGLIDESAAKNSNGIASNNNESATSSVPTHKSQAVAMWKKIERIRKYGKLLIDGTELDIASVIAVAK